MGREWQQLLVLPPLPWRVRRDHRGQARAAHVEVDQAHLVRVGSRARITGRVRVRVRVRVKARVRLRLSVKIMVRDRERVRVRVRVRVR